MSGAVENPAVDNPQGPVVISTVGDMATFKRLAGPAVGVALLLFTIAGSSNPVVVLAWLPLVAVFTVATLLWARTGSRFADGPPAELAEATWSATVTIHEGAGLGVPIGGVLAVWPDRVGFLPSDKAVRAGRAPWQLSSELLSGVEVRRGVVGAWITVSSQVGPDQAFVCRRWQGCREAVAALGVPVR